MISAAITSVGEVGRVFEAVVAEPEDVEVHLVALRQLVVAERAPAAVRVVVRPRGLAVVPVLRLVSTGPPLRDVKRSEIAAT
jgi:hypothetical protein